MFVVLLPFNCTLPILLHTFTYLSTDLFFSWVSSLILFSWWFCYWSVLLFILLLLLLLSFFIISFPYYFTHLFNYFSDLFLSSSLEGFIIDCSSCSLRVLFYYSVCTFITFSFYPSKSHHILVILISGTVPYLPLYGFLEGVSHD